MTAVMTQVPVPTAIIGSQSDFRFFVWLGHVDQGHVNRLDDGIVIGTGGEVNPESWTQLKGSNETYI